MSDERPGQQSSSEQAGPVAPDDQPEPLRPAAARFLEQLQQAERPKRGRLTVYLGAAPGVGKTYAMLQAAHRLKAEGTDVVAGFLETHGRAETVALISGLEYIPRKSVSYKGVTLEEMDVAAILARKPAVCLVDELAHTNAPGSDRPKGWCTRQTARRPPSPTSSGPAT